MNQSLVIMGVSGCGKSSLAAAVAEAEGLPLIEGDAHHSEASREKMRHGIALTDADRAGWLERLQGGDGREHQEEDACGDGEIAPAGLIDDGFE